MPNEYTKVTLSRELLTDPEFYFNAYRWKVDAALFCRLPETAHRLHTGNALRAAHDVYAVPLEALFAKFEAWTLEQKPVHYIFMTDFCCSTLLARALGSLEGFCCYNEPRAFVSLSNEKRRVDFLSADGRRRWQQALTVAIRLMSRTYRPDDVALIKEQPLTNYIIDDLIEINPWSRAIFLYSTLADYLGAVCRQERRREYVRYRMLHNFHETRTFQVLAGVDKTALDAIQLAALHWLTQMYQFLRLHERLPAARFCSLRSDVFLSDPRGVLWKAAHFYNIKAAPGDIQAVVDGKLFRTHSKQMGQAFDPGSRLQQAELSAARYASEISAGLEWASHFLACQPVPDILPAALAT